MSTSAAGVQLDRQIHIHDHKSGFLVFPEHKEPTLVFPEQSVITIGVPAQYRGSLRGSGLSPTIYTNHNQWISLITARMKMQTRGALSSTTIHLVYAADGVSAAAVVAALQPPHDKRDNVRHVAVVVRGMQRSLGIPQATHRDLEFEFRCPGDDFSCSAAIEVPFDLPSQFVGSKMRISWLSYALSYICLSSDTDGDTFLRYTTELLKTTSPGCCDMRELASHISQHPSLAPILTLVMRNTDKLP